MFLETMSLTVPLVSGVAFEEVFEDAEETWSAWFRFLHDDSNIRSRNLQKSNVGLSSHVTVLINRFI